MGCCGSKKRTPKPVGTTGYRSKPTGAGSHQSHQQQQPIVQTQKVSAPQTHFPPPKHSPKPEPEPQSRPQPKPIPTSVPANPICDREEEQPP